MSHITQSACCRCCRVTRVRRARVDGKNPKSCDEVFERLVTEGVDPDDLYHEVTHQVRVKEGGNLQAAVCRLCCCQVLQAILHLEGIKQVEQKHVL